MVTFMELSKERWRGNGSRLRKNNTSRNIAAACRRTNGNSSGLIRRSITINYTGRRALDRLRGKILAIIRRRNALPKFKIVFAAVFATTLCLLPLQAGATLGGDASTTQADQARLKASLRITPGEKFAVHEMTLPTGTVVREYVSPQGQVFAVSWKGPFKPDLRQLMGDYFDRYVQASPNTRGGHSASRVAQTD